MKRSLPPLFQRFLASGIIQSSAIVYLGSLANAGLSFFSSVLLGRSLGPGAYGLFSTAVAALLLLNEMTDLGINPGLIRYAAYYLQRGEIENARTTFRFAFRSRVFFTLFFVSGGFIFAPLLATLLGQPSLTPLLRVAFLGVIPFVLMSFFGAVLQAEQRFGRYISLNLVSGASRMLITLAVIHSHLTPLTAVAAYTVSPLAAALMGIFLVNRSLLTLTTYNREVIRQVRSFSLWMASWALFASIQGRLDQFMVTRMLGDTAAGQYAAAYQLSAVFTFLVAAIGTVLNPRLAGMAVGKLRAAARMNRSYVIIVVLAGIGIALAGHALLPLLFGLKYAAALPLFSWLLVGLTFFGLSALPNSILNALNRPYVFSISSAIGLVLTGICNLIFIPRYGLIGVGYTFGIVNAAGYLVSYFCMHFFLKQAE